MRELEYPFDSDYIILHRKGLRKKLFSDLSVKRIHKKIAILGGSTTDNVKNIMELFLLNYGIEPEFYQSEYAQYWQDVMFDNEELLAFSPDIIYIHTSSRNIKKFPTVKDTMSSIEVMLESEYRHFEMMWEKIGQIYQCPIIQNNFEQFPYRLLGYAKPIKMEKNSIYVIKCNGVIPKSQDVLYMDFYTEALIGTADGALSQPLETIGNSGECLMIITTEGQQDMDVLFRIVYRGEENLNIETLEVYKTP